jgi:hypothetical protein
VHDSTTIEQTNAPTVQHQVLCLSQHVEQPLEYKCESSLCNVEFNPNTNTVIYTAIALLVIAYFVFLIGI